MELVIIGIDKKDLEKFNSEYSATAQLLVAVEESGEFIASAMRFENRDGKNDIEDLKESVAQALIPLLQMRHIIGEDDIDARMRRNIYHQLWQGQDDRDA
jgi:indole-3-glycerol phosphate synthase